LSRRKKAEEKDWPTGEKKHNAEKKRKDIRGGCRGKTKRNFSKKRGRKEKKHVKKRQEKKQVRDEKRSG